MAYCSHCGYASAASALQIACANCGRKKVKPSKRKPTSYTTVSAYQERYGKNATQPMAAAVMAAIFCGATLLFLYVGFWVRGVAGLFFDIFGILCGVAAVKLISGWMRSLSTDRSPEKAYIDHLHDLAESRAALEAKLSELHALRDNLPPPNSEKAENRLKLLESAIENRQAKLDLVREGEFLIHARRKIARIQALASDLAEAPAPGEIERDLNEAFADLRALAKQAPSVWRSAAGEKMNESLRQTLALHASLQEQMEDRKVLAALGDENASSSPQAVAMDQVLEQIEQSAFDAEWDVLDLAETAAADEDYLRINTEWRLTSDGMKMDRD